LNVKDQNKKLFSCPSSDNIIEAYIVSERTSDHAKDLIPDDCPVCFVGHIEVIDVDKKNAQGKMVFVHLIHPELDLGFQISFIAQFCEGIEEAHFPEFLYLLRNKNSRGSIVKRFDSTNDLLFRIQDRHNTHKNRESLSFFVVQIGFEAADFSILKRFIHRAVVFADLKFIAVGGNQNVLEAFITQNLRFCKSCDIHSALIPEKEFFLGIQQGDAILQIFDDVLKKIAIYVFD
jgi:hypothetical protein